VTEIARLRLTDFRNYETADIEPAPGLNLVVGANAQGKTNLLEAIGLVATGRLFRGGRDANAVRSGASEAQVVATLSGAGTELGVVLRLAKRASVSGASLPRASDLIGRLPCVSFSAADLEIVSGEPADRRHFLDTEIAQARPAYLGHLAAYRRALEQRNALLRRASESFVPGEVFEPWEATLAASGAALRSLRDEWLAEVVPFATAAQAALGGGEEIGLAVVPADEGDLARELPGKRDADVARGSTTVGPHRDELLVTVAGREARHFGSQGQRRTAVIALKLAAFESARRAFGQPPVLLLDDVFSDLDAARRSALIERTVGLGGQVLLTCTEAEQAGAAALGSARRFVVRSGAVRVE
jgi:DNA replication and repair protein RecF